MEGMIKALKDVIAGGVRKGYSSSLIGQMNQIMAQGQKNQWIGIGLKNSCLQIAKLLEQQDPAAANALRQAVIQYEAASK